MIFLIPIIGALITNDMTSHDKMFLLYNQTVSQDPVNVQHYHDAMTMYIIEKTRPKSRFFFNWCRKNKHKCYAFGESMMVDDMNMVISILEKEFDFTFCRPYFHASYEDTDPTYINLPIVDKIKKMEFEEGEGGRGTGRGRGRGNTDVIYIDMLPEFRNDAFSIPKISLISVPHFKPRHILYKNRTIDMIIRDDIKAILSSSPSQKESDDDAWKTFIADCEKGVGRIKIEGQDKQNMQDVRVSTSKRKKITKQGYRHIHSKMDLLLTSLCKRADDLKKIDSVSEKMLTRLSDTLKSREDKIIKSVEKIRETNEPLYFFLDLDQTIIGGSDFESQGMTSFCSLDPESCERTMTMNKAYKKNKEFVRQSIRPNFERFIAYIKGIRMNKKKSREVKVFIVSAGLGTKHVHPKVIILEDILGFTFDRPLFSRCDLQKSGRVKHIPAILKKLNLWDEGVYDRSVLLIDDKYHHHLYTKKLLLIPEYELCFDQTDVLKNWIRSTDNVWENIVLAFGQIEKLYGTLILTQDIISVVQEVLFAPKTYQKISDEINVILRGFEGSKLLP